MSHCCRSCARNLEPGQEICPHCLTSLRPAECRFTVESTAPLQRQSGSLSSVYALPDLDQIDFRPSPPFFKLFSYLRGGLMSALIALVCMALGGVGWVQAQRAEGRDQERVAEESFDKGQYDTAAAAWESAFEAYEHGFDESGKVSALVGLSRCYVQGKDFTEALVVLQRAQKIKSDESVVEMLKKCHRLAAVEHLQRAQQLFVPGSFGKAYLESELAMDGFLKGEGTAAQRAGAFRMACRCSIELEDFGGAQEYLDLAFESEGESEMNLALQTECDEAADEYQGQLVADIGKDGYIPQGKLDPIAIQREAEARHPRRDRYSGYRTRSYSSSNRSSGYRGSSSYSSYRPRVRHNSDYRSTSTRRTHSYTPTRRIQTTLGTTASYPTHNPEPTYPDSRYYTGQGYGSSSYRVQPGFNPRHSSIRNAYRAPVYTSPRNSSVGYPIRSPRNY